MSSTETPKNDKADQERFDTAHAKELGFKRFAYIQSLYIFVPIITGGIAFAIGYVTLGKPIARMFPKLSGFAGGTEKIMANHKNLSFEHAARAAEMKAAGHSGAEIMEALGMKLDEVPRTAKFAGAWGLGIIGSIAGSIGVGYDRWRKEESSRLAADEINHDIANLELFRASNPELVSENKRLRTMLAEMPTAQVQVAELTHKGRASAVQPEQQIA
ncbi:MAG: hypothetical protein V4735_00465 [Pseudomonadota bacterium]